MKSLQAELAQDGPVVSLSKLCRWLGRMSAGPRITHVWCGKDRRASLAVVIDCCIREILGWRLVDNGLMFSSRHYTATVRPTD